jgi:hypothetical protein
MTKFERSIILTAEQNFRTRAHMQESRLNLRTGINPHHFFFIDWVTDNPVLNDRASTLAFGLMASR